MKVVLHAPTAEALIRARSNLKNLRAAAPEAEALIIANAGGVAAALDTPDDETDSALRLCANTLRKTGRSAPAGSVVIDAAVVELARLQAAGWAYIRA